MTKPSLDRIIEQLQLCIVDARALQLKMLERILSIALLEAHETKEKRAKNMTREASSGADLTFAALVPRMPPANVPGRVLKNLRRCPVRPDTDRLCANAANVAMGQKAIDAPQLSPTTSSSELPSCEVAS